MLRLLALGLLSAGMLYALLWVLLPGDRIAPDRGFDVASLPADLDGYLDASERTFSDLVPGIEKQIKWAGAPGAKTPLAIVYLHGFSASAQELRPVPDRVAEALGANLYFARLSGHGRSGEALAQARAEDWMRDTQEALAIGRRLGDRVIVIGTSTGGTLAALVAIDPDMAQAVAGVVLVSPNFKIANPAAALLTAPFARVWVPLITGPERRFETANADHATYWTERYPIGAVFPMAHLVRHARRQDYGRAAMPALILLSDQDQVVRPDVSRKIAARWGGGATVVTMPPGAGIDPSGHVIAGDILSPAGTGPAVRAIVDWARGL